MLGHSTQTSVLYRVLDCCDEGSLSKGRGDDNESRPGQEETTPCMMRHGIIRDVDTDDDSVYTTNNIS